MTPTTYRPSGWVDPNAELRREYENLRHNQAQVVDYRTAQTPQFMEETRRLFEVEAEMKRRGLLRWRL